MRLLFTFGREYAILRRLKKEKTGRRRKMRHKGIKAQRHQGEAQRQKNEAQRETTRHKGRKTRHKGTKAESKGQRQKTRHRGTEQGISCGFGRWPRLFY